MTISSVFSKHSWVVYALSMFVFVRKPIPDSRILTSAPPAYPALVLLSPWVIPWAQGAVEAQPVLFHQMNDVLAPNITPKFAAESLLTLCGQHTAPFLLFGVEHPPRVFKPVS